MNCRIKLKGECKIKKYTQEEIQKEMKRIRFEFKSGISDFRLDISEGFDNFYGKQDCLEEGKPAKSWDELQLEKTLAIYEIILEEVEKILDSMNSNTYTIKDIIEKLDSATKGQTWNMYYDEFSILDDLSCNLDNLNDSDFEFYEEIIETEFGGFATNIHLSFHFRVLDTNSNGELIKKYLDSKIKKEDLLNLEIEYVIK